MRKIEELIEELRSGRRDRVGRLSIISALVQLITQAPPKRDSQTPLEFVEVVSEQFPVLSQIFSSRDSYKNLALIILQSRIGDVNWDVVVEELMRAGMVSKKEQERAEVVKEILKFLYDYGLPEYELPPIQEIIENMLISATNEVEASVILGMIPRIRAMIPPVLSKLQMEIRQSLAGRVEERKVLLQSINESIATLKEVIDLLASVEGTVKKEDKKTTMEMEIENIVEVLNIKLISKLPVVYQQLWNEFLKIVLSEERSNPEVIQRFVIALRILKEERASDFGN